MYKYMYVASIKEYLDFCIELIGLHSCAWEFFRELEEQNKFSDANLLWSTVFNEYFIESFEEIFSVELKEKFNIIIKFEDLMDIVMCSGIDYRNAKGDLNTYLSSPSVEKIKLFFFDSQLDNVELIDYWIYIFKLEGLSEDLQRCELGMDLRDFQKEWITPCNPFEINSVVENIYSNFYMYEKVVSMNYDVATHYAPLSKVRFTPSKFMLLLYQIFSIKKNNVQYLTQSDKCKAIFKLVELIFGVIEEDRMFVTIIRDLTSALEIESYDGDGLHKWEFREDEGYSFVRLDPFIGSRTDVEAYLQEYRTEMKAFKRKGNSDRMFNYSNPSYNIKLF